MKRKRIRLHEPVRRSSIAVFDIVNGFLIDAVAHGAAGLRTCGAMRHLQMYNLAEIIFRAIERRQALCRPVVDGVDSQA